MSRQLRRSKFRTFDFVLQKTSAVVGRPMPIAARTQSTVRPWENAAYSEEPSTPWVTIAATNR